MKGYSTPAARDDIRTNMIFLRGLHQGAREAKRAAIKRFTTWVIGLLGAALAAAYGLTKLPPPQ